MPIEFHCPYCTAAIRVADRAAGKRGQCPKCGTRLVVPAPDTPQLPGPDDATTSASPEIPVFDAPQPAASPDSSIAKRVRRRRTANWKIPILFGGLLLGALAVYYWEPAMSLEGELEAIVLSDTTLPPVTIDASLIEAEDATRDFVLQDLQDAPQLLRSPDFLDVQFLGTSAGVQIQVFSSPRTELIALNLKQEDLLWDYVRRHATELDKPRRDELSAALRKFAVEWTSARRNNPSGVVRDMLQYRNQIGLNALVGGIGYHVQAVVGSRTYRCISQQDSRLYFALPRGTKTFVLRGRSIQGRDPVFPGTYTVEVLREDQTPEDGTLEGQSQQDELQQGEQSPDEPIDADDAKEADDGRNAKNAESARNGDSAVETDLSRAECTRLC